MVKAFGLLVFATVLLVLAICLVFFPRKSQVIAIRAVNWGLPSEVRLVNSYMGLVAKFVESNQYRICLRLIGGLSFLFSSFVVWLLIKHLRGEY